MKAILHYAASPGFRRKLEALRPGWLSVAVVAESDRAALDAHLPEVEAILHVLEPLTAQHIAAAPRLRLIQKIGVGVNTIDLAAAAARGIAVANMPGTNSRAVAEMTLLLMLAALRRLSLLDRHTRAGRGWACEADLFDGVGEIGGRTVGLVGYGAVPRILAPMLRALGCRVLYTARTAKDDAVADWRDLESLLGESDIVSLHLPLMPETTRLLDARRIALMKQGAILVNTARGGLVDEAALVEALMARRLMAAGLDVHGHEPVEPGSPLLAIDTVVVAPHVAWLTPETLDRSLTVAFENCRRLRDGEVLLNRVQ